MSDIGNCRRSSTTAVPAGGIVDVRVEYGRTNSIDVVFEGCFLPGILFRKLHTRELCIAVLKTSSIFSQVHSGNTVNIGTQADCILDTPGINITKGIPPTDDIHREVQERQLRSRSCTGEGYPAHRESIVSADEYATSSTETRTKGLCHESTKRRWVCTRWRLRQFHSLVFLDSD